MNTTAQFVKSSAVRHLSASDELSHRSVSTATKGLETNLAAVIAQLNALIADVRASNPVAPLVLTRTLVAALSTEHVANFRIPTAFQACITNATLVTTGSGSLSVVHSAGTSGSTPTGTGLTQVALTTSEYTGSSSWFGYGEFIVSMTNSGTTSAEMSGSLVVELKKV